MTSRILYLSGLFLGMLLPFATFAQTPTITGVENAASFSTVVSPGAIASIFGSNLATSNNEAGVTVMLGSEPCYVIYSSAAQINVQLPVQASAGPASLTVSHDGLTSAGFSVTLAAYAPAIYTLSGSGTGAGEFIDAESGSLVSSNTPAHVGDTITFFATGLGPTNPVVPTGTPAPTNTLVHTVTTPTLTIMAFRRRSRSPAWRPVKSALTK